MCQWATTSFVTTVLQSNLSTLLNMMNVIIINKFKYPMLIANITFLRQLGELQFLNRFFVKSWVSCLYICITLIFYVILFVLLSLEFHHFCLNKTKCHSHCIIRWVYFDYISAGFCHPMNYDYWLSNSQWNYSFWSIN